MVGLIALAVALVFGALLGLVAALFLTVAYAVVSVGGLARALVAQVGIGVMARRSHA